jgi:hypothetical protein
MAVAGHTPSAGRLSDVAGAWKAAPLLLVFATAVALRAMSGTNVDVGWLLTVGEKMLAGERLYVDLIETNPPASPLLYLPAILISRATGFSPEGVVDGLVLFAAGCSLWVSGQILARARLLDDFDAWSLAAGSAAVLTILPMHTFGEREHIATMTLLPFLALRAANPAPAFSSVIVAGLGAGLTVVIKPHFVVAVGLAVAAAAYARESWRIIFAVENWIAAAVTAAYGVFVVVAYPEFVYDVMPLVQAVYVPMRADLWMLVSNPPLPSWLVVVTLLTMWKRGAVLRPPLALLLSASAGFVIIYLFQGKGWPYHSYPILALAFIALIFAGAGQGRGLREEARPRSDRLKQVAATLLVGAVAALSCIWLSLARDMDPLIEPIRRLKARPSLLAITSDISVGHPLVRQLGGRWVSRVSNLWISSGVSVRLADEKLTPDMQARLRRYGARDRDMLAEDILRNRPDIILVQRDISDWDKWARSDPLLVECLKAYHEAAVIGTFTILRRNEE